MSPISLAAPYYPMPDNATGFALPQVNPETGECETDCFGIGQDCDSLPD